MRGTVSNCSNCVDTPAAVECAQCSKNGSTYVKMCRLCDDVLHRHPEKRSHFRSSCKGEENSWKLSRKLREISDGIIVHEPLYSPVPWNEFRKDLFKIESVRSDEASTRFAQTRLNVLGFNYDLHCLFNGFIEKELLKKSQTDFQNVAKVMITICQLDVSDRCQVDTQIQAQSAPCSSHLLSFIKEKVLLNPSVSSTPL